MIFPLLRNKNVSPRDRRTEIVRSVVNNRTALLRRDVGGDFVELCAIGRLPQLAGTGGSKVRKAKISRDMS